MNGDAKAGLDVVGAPGLSKQQVAEEGYAKCERLLMNADVRWFIEEAIVKPRAAKEAELKDVTTDKDAREIAAHVREALERVEQFLPRQRDIYARQVARGKL